MVWAQFTKEIEENGKLPFLDCLVSRDNNELRTIVYRKPTYTEDYLTNHPTTRPHTKPRLWRRWRDEGNYFATHRTAYEKETDTLKDYNADFIKRNIYRPTETDATTKNPTPLTKVTIPYIKGTSETI